MLVEHLGYSHVAQSYRVKYSTVCYLIKSAKTNRKFFEEIWAREDELETKQAAIERRGLQCLVVEKPIFRAS